MMLVWLQDGKHNLVSDIFSRKHKNILNLPSHLRGLFYGLLNLEEEKYQKLKLKYNNEILKIN